MVDFAPERIFGPKGLLSKKLPYFDYRASQLEYAKEVRKALSEKHVSLLEAQTGTGKTLGYLIPALESDSRIIVSTGTKALQEQLFFKDIPLLQEELGFQFQAILMKGRMNYLCLLKYERVQSEAVLPDMESVEQLKDIQQWASHTDTGDIGESGVPDYAGIWKELTISADACLGAKCRFYSQCFIYKLKARSEEAKIIVVNHHLFFADLSLQVSSGTSIFPPYDVVIFDEAHQLADTATHNLSTIFSQAAFRDLYQDLMKELQVLRVKEKQDVSAAQTQTIKLGESVAKLFDKFTALPQKLRYDKHSIVKVVESHGVVVDKMFTSLVVEVTRFLDKTEDMPQISRRLAGFQASLSFLLRGEEEAYVYWAERNDQRDWSLHASPLDVSDILKKALWPNLESAVLTSATLFVDKKGNTISSDLGIDHPIEASFPYNFDYQSQACLYIPNKIPDPTDPTFAEAAGEQIVKLVKTTEGSAFVLCTSYANLKVYQELLKRLDYPLLVQGSRSRQALLKSFIKNPGSVLLGTMSFWQGIDVQGEALVSVIIDKLPFASPADPLTEAKIQYLRKSGRDAFNSYQLPAAVMLLKQGLGRLIRTNVDYGVLAVLDRRIVTKSYGEVFLRNLPPMPIINEMRDLKKAFEERRARFSSFHT
jgi:ATP-dependent DNA helicase DinG